MEQILVSMSISDTESDTPFSASFSGPNAETYNLYHKMKIHRHTYQLQTTGTINSGTTYSYTSST